MLSHELAKEIATKVLGLTAVEDLWCSGGEHPTGLKVATRLGHLPHEGYFRPDVSYWQLKLCEFAIWEGTLGKAQVKIEWKGKKMRVYINDGEIETSLSEPWDLDEGKQNIAECILQFAEDSERFKPI